MAKTTSEAQKKTKERLISDTSKAFSIIDNVLKPKKTLVDLLYTLQQADMELLSFSPEEQAGMVDDLGDKVDSYKYIIDKFDSEITRISDQISYLCDTKQSLANNKEKLRELMAYHMREKGFEKLPGKIWNVALRNTKYIDYSLGEATSNAYRHYGEEFISRNYSWNKANIKNKILAEPEKYRELGEVREKSHVVFTVRKDLSSE